STGVEAKAGFAPNELCSLLLQAAHIPRALFFDLDGISDRSTSLPHMLPSEQAFAAGRSALGIDNKDGVVVYDGNGLFSAARVWWLLDGAGKTRT
ncbi:hypothetical protein HID58_062961, partial [Brassica napus]